MFPFIESNCHCINWICSFQALSMTALLRSKANWWLGSQLVQQRFRCNCLSKWLWRYADSGTFKGAEVLFLNMASYNIVHQHGNGFEHEIGNISVPWLALDNIGEVSKKHDKKSLYSSCMGWYWIQWCRAKALTFDGNWGRSCFCRASGDSFGQYVRFRGVSPRPITFLDWCFKWSKLFKQSNKSVNKIVEQGSFGKQLMCKEK